MPLLQTVSRTLNLISLYVDDLVIAGTIDAVESVKAREIQDEGLGEDSSYLRL